MIGNTVTFRMANAPTGHAGHTAALPRVGASAARGLQQNIGASPLAKARTSDAISNIIAIVAGMNDAAQARSAKSSIDEAIAAYAENNTHDAQDALSEMYAHLDQFKARAPASHQSFAQALETGQVKVERLADEGVQTWQEVTLQFDGDRQVGSSIVYGGSDDAVRALQAKMGITDGTLSPWGVDNATGRNATWMAFGNDYFYMTW